MSSSPRGVIEPWPSGDLGSADPLSPRIARAVLNNAAHLVDAQCQPLVCWVRPSGSYRTASASTTPQLLWRGLVPVTRRPNGAYAQWIVQLMVSSATAGSVTWYAGARPRGELGRAPRAAPTDDSEAVNSTSAVWTSPLIVRPETSNPAESVPTTPDVSATDPLILVVQQGWAQIGVWAGGPVVPRLHGVAVREFGGT